jgi:hypothetical protein
MSATAADGIRNQLPDDTLLVFLSASARLAVAVAGLVGAVVIIGSSVPMWNQILAYAQGEPTGTDRSGGAPRTERS